MSQYYNSHNRLASACPVSNLSPVFRPSIKREIRIREANTQQHEKRLPISYLALKTLKYQQNIHKVELKSLYFNLVYVFSFSAKTGIYEQTHTHIQKVELKSLYFNLVCFFLFSAKTRIYKQNTRTYTQSGAENSLCQFCLTITEPFTPFYLEEMKNY